MLWALARLGYVFAYRADAERRQSYFLAQLVVFAALWIGALAGT